MLSKEKKWYESQLLEVPFVKFFDNSHIISKDHFNFLFLPRGIVSIYTFSSFILDVFHNKTKGIFTLLNDECILKSPSIENFANSLKSAWKEDNNSPISWEIRRQKSNENMFSIRHFTNDVTYSAVKINL